MRDDSHKKLMEAIADKPDEILLAYRAGDQIKVMCAYNNASFMGVLERYINAYTNQFFQTAPLKPVSNGENVVDINSKKPEDSK